jgi:general stress protein 26
MPTSQKKLEELDALIDGIETAMFTTRRHDGHLVSRPMATQKRIKDSDLWFVTDSDAHKLDDLLMDPHVNCSYYNMKSREWVSVSGVARISRDKKKIHDLYEPDWKAWFGDEGGDRNGGPNDPRLALIEVEAHEATYLKSNQPRAVQLFKVAKALITGDAPKIGDMRHVGKKELEARR